MLGIFLKGLKGTDTTVYLDVNANLNILTLLKLLNTIPRYIHRVTWPYLKQTGAYIIKLFTIVIYSAPH